MQKSTAIGLRIIASSYYSFPNNISSLIDTGTYFYPNAFTRNDTTIIESIGDEGTFKDSLTYNANGNITQDVQTSQSGSSWLNDYEYNYTYNTFDSISQEIDQYWNTNTNSWSVYSQTLYTYNSANLITQRLVQSWSTSINSWQNSNEDVYTYDAGNHITSHLYATYSGSVWDSSYRYLYTTDASGNNTQTIYQLYNNGWINSHMNNDSFNASNQLVQALSSTYNTSSNSWNLTGRSLYNYDANGNDTTIVTQQYNSSTNSYANFHLSGMIYNNYNQLTSVTDAYWDTTTAAFDMLNAINNYYYESYTNTGIGNLVSQGTLYSIYPQPAANVLNISISWNNGAQSSSAVLTDMQGRVFRSFSAPAARQLSTSISVTDLPAGNYLLRFMGSNGEVASQIISVAH